jgi:hypothetical protein
MSATCTRGTCGCWRNAMSLSTGCKATRTSATRRLPAGGCGESALGSGAGGAQAMARGWSKTARWSILASSRTSVAARESIASSRTSANAGRGVNRESALTDYFAKLAHRLRHVRVCCGDWSRVLGDSPTVKLAPVTAIVLDPPYDTEANRQADLYTHDAQGISAAVREWALDHGDDPRLRIVLCGYEGEHDMPGWSEVPWKAKGGYGSQGDGQGRDNAARERLWFSPHCLPVVPRQASMFDEVAA